MNSSTSIARAGITAVMVFTMAVSVFFPAAAATFSATIDFEGLAEGTIVSSVSHGSGISGDDGGGSVPVFAAHPPREPDTNRAMIFDATCAGGCSGDDDDLFQPSLGNVLIISEDLDSSDPDDMDRPGAFYSFDFSGWADGVVTVESITVLDIEFDENEGDATVKVYSGGFTELLATVFLPDTGNGGMAVVPINVSGADSMIVDLNGSGAIDNIGISWEEEEDGFEGCTPGFWRQPHHFDSWVGYSPGDSYDSTFGLTSSFGGTLLEALERGGGGESALGRHAVAALLNAASPEVDYQYSEAEVIAMVQAAYSSGEFEDVKDTFELQNELGCGLD